MSNALTILPFGTQYYRSPTPRPDAWETDIANIRLHGFNTVKLMALWRWCCPSPDRYYFDDIDRLMDLCAQNDLKVVINVVFPMPVWLYQQYPDCLMETASGEKLYPTALPGGSAGGYPGPCYHHAESRRLRMEFLHTIVSRYANHPALLCWDVANEPELTTSIKREEKVEDLTCYCENSAAEFRLWLKNKYKDIDALNTLWARNYQSFDDVELPRTTGAFMDMIDWRLFMTDTITYECRLRIATAKKADSVHPVMVHTVTIPYFPLSTCGSDDYALSQDCDLFGNSVGSEPLSAAITLSAAPGKMVINSEIHAVGGTTYDRPKLNTMEDMKRHIFEPLSAGIKGFLFWQYRPERLGLESPAWGLTDMKGNDTPWLKATEAIAAAIQRHADVILDSEPNAQVAVLNSQRMQLFDFCVRPGGDWYIQAVKGAHAMLRAAGYAVEVVGDLLMTPEHLSRYKVLYDPFPYFKDEKTCRILRDWVAAGGTLIAECCFGQYSADDGMNTLDQPGFSFDEVFGSRELRVTTAAKFLNAYGSSWSAGESQDLLSFTMGDKTYHGFHFYQAIAPTQSQVLATFDDGTAAITANHFGKGTAVWIGTLPANAYERGCRENVYLISQLVHTQAGLSPTLRTDRLQTVASLLNADFGQLVVVDNRTETDGVTLTASADTLKGSMLVNILTDESTPVIFDGGTCTAALPVHAGCIDAYRLQ